MEKESRICCTPFGVVQVEMNASSSSSSNGTGLLRDAPHFSRTHIRMYSAPPPSTPPSGKRVKLFSGVSNQHFSEQYLD